MIGWKTTYFITTKTVKRRTNPERDISPKRCAGTTGPCMAGGKAAAEVRAVTAVTVRCSSFIVRHFRIFGIEVQSRGAIGILGRNQGGSESFRQPSELGVSE